MNEVIDFARPPRHLTAKVSRLTFAMYMIFITDFFMHISNRIPALWKFRPTVLVVLVIAGFLVTQIPTLRARPTSPVFRALLILLAYMFLALPAVQFPGSVVRYHIPEFVKALVFFFFTAWIVDTPKRLKFFLGLFVFTQVFRVVEPLYLNLTTGYWGDSTHLGGGEFANRLGGAPADIINANELGFVIVTIIPFLHYLLGGSRFKHKLLYWILLGPLLYALVLTQSRGSLLVLGVVAWFIFRDSRHKPLLVGVAIGIMVFAWANMSDVQKDRYLSLVGQSHTNNATTSEGRILGIISEFQLGLSRPIFGHGLGTTPEAKVHAGGKPRASHNLYGQLMIELGLIGSILFLRFIYLAYRSLVEMTRYRRGPPTAWDPFFMRLNRTLTVVFFVYAVYSINYWGLSQYYWYMFAGLVFAFSRIRNSVDTMSRWSAERARAAATVRR